MPDSIEIKVVVRASGSDVAWQRLWTWLLGENELLPQSLGGIEERDDEEHGHNNPGGSLCRGDSQTK